jgi:hypothetical protein
VQACPPEVPAAGAAEDSPPQADYPAVVAVAAWGAVAGDLTAAVALADARG